MTSGYHDSKFSGSQQSFLTETAICIVERWRKSMGYRFVLAFNHAQESYACQPFCYFLSYLQDHGFVEIQKPWQPRKRDLTTSPLYSTMGFSENVAVAKTSLQ